MPETFSFGIDPVTTHAWNSNHTEVAVSLNNHEVKVFKKTGITYNNTATLKEHGQRVTSIDWAPKSNSIVTCGADRNAYVWTLQDDGQWKPVLVILRINRAATCVRWSPDENKFAVGSGARIISICYFEEDNKWWVSKHIKKPIRSTVTCIDWHPNNILLAAGSTDFKARVFSGYIKDIEKKPSATTWGSKMTLGNLMCEYSNGGGGWVHSVSFSPSGEKLAWVGHDASVSVAMAGSGDAIAVVKGNFLPFMSLTWVTENSMVCVGYDCCPKLFTHSDDGQVTFISDLDIPQEKDQMTMSAMNRFRQMDKTGTAESTGEVKTKHQNTITKVSVYAGTKADCTKFSTSGADGQLIIWDFKSLEKSISGLKIA
ncbi:actin-related protein 2/3 complex subunit 1A-like [Ylistrum balloti]|uniref:actin-related protein 2/3 complex subunit 1A-like n=1 Tax=Ylistrum balloti TaxID=509963 RepID=UPI002905831E|nr:actin-related protein 2/3 complex subunit 1A-like [Ylistrum balloti]